MSSIDLYICYLQTHLSFAGRRPPPPESTEPLQWPTRLYIHRTRVEVTPRKLSPVSLEPDLLTGVSGVISADITIEGVPRHRH